jgi:NAD(P)H-hydrate epimerase
MATGGTGDVLTGALLGFLAQGLKPVDAAQVAVYVHGLAGDLAAAEIGNAGTLAGDLLSRLPRALRQVASS